MLNLFNNLSSGFLGIMLMMKNSTYNNVYYYSFKIFPCFWFTITGCCSPNLERIFAILNQWRQKCSPLQITEPMTSKWRQKCSLLQIIEPLTEKTWRRYYVISSEQENKEWNGDQEKTRKYFEWIKKQWLNLAFVGYEEFCRSQRVLSTSAFGLCG